MVRSQNCRRWNSARLALNESKLPKDHDSADQAIPIDLNWQSQIPLARFVVGRGLPIAITDTTRQSAAKVPGKRYFEAWADSSKN